MKLLQLKAKNFRSFAELELDLNASGLFAVTGVNGAGKSTIFSAVEWALYGGKRGAGAQRALRQGVDGEECKVEVELEVGGRVLNVTRVDGDNAWLTDVGTKEELAQGLTETSRAVAVQLGLTQEMFCGTFYARQKEVEALSSKSLSDRKDQLELLLGVQHLRVAADLAEREAREQKLLVEGLRQDAPDVDHLRAEVERCECEAQEAAPTVATLKGQVAELETKVKEVNKGIDQLTSQIKEHGSRQVAAEKATAELELEQRSLEGLRSRLQDAEAASVELAKLQAALDGTEDLGAREREMDLDRRNHELVEDLRAKERLALEQLASATDALSDLGDPGAGEDPAAQLSSAQQQLNDIGRKLREAATIREKAAERARLANEKLKRAKRASAIEHEIAKLSGAEAQAEEMRERWQKLRAEKANLDAQLAHDIKHRNALAGEDESESGVCPTCHRKLEGTLGDLVAEFEAEISERESRLAELESEMAKVSAAGKKLKAAAEKEARLRLEREGLPATADESKLSAEVAGIDAMLEKASKVEADLAQLDDQTAARLPDLERAAKEAAATAQKRREAQERATKAEQQTVFFAEQLAENKTNGYDAKAHAELKAELEQRQNDLRRAAVLREKTETVELLEKQIAAQEPEVDRLTEKVNRLRDSAANIAPDQDAQEKMTSQRDKLCDELDKARKALDAAMQKVSLESQAVGAARSRLEEASTLHKRIDQERRELELRTAVARALEAYREHASQLNRPLLETEASALLKQVTGSIYPIVRLTERYLLEIADGNEFFSSKRFSGGEQDLAALCLRLALARTLAHQRGTEQSFIVLDEVFGGQDVGRRQTLLEALTELAKSQFQQIFVISHTDDVIDHCSLHITVTRENGISSAAGPATA